MDSARLIIKNPDEIKQLFSEFSDFLEFYSHSISLETSKFPEMQRTITNLKKWESIQLKNENEVICEYEAKDKDKLSFSEEIRMDEAKEKKQRCNEILSALSRYENDVVALSDKSSELSKQINSLIQEAIAYIGRADSYIDKLLELKLEGK